MAENFLLGFNKNLIYFSHPLFDLYDKSEDTENMKIKEKLVRLRSQIFKGKFVILCLLFIFKLKLEGIAIWENGISLSAWISPQL